MNKAAAWLALLAASAVSMSMSVAAPAPLSALEQNKALSDSQAAIGRNIGEHLLLDRRERPLSLKDYRGKPLLVSFIYTGCFQVCPGNTRKLAEAVTGLQKTLGPGLFKIVSIGFNQPADSPGAMRSFAAQLSIDNPDWEFLSPPAATVKDLIGDFGFSYVPTPAGFEHILQLSVVDAQGRIYRQLYGEALSPEQIAAPLRQLLAGQPVAAEPGGLAALVERVRIFCSVYDPLTGTYRVSYGLVFEIAGGITFILWFAGLFLGEWWKRRVARRQLGV